MSSTSPPPSSAAATDTVCIKYSSTGEDENCGGQLAPGLSPLFQRQTLIDVWLSSSGSSSSTSSATSGGNYSKCHKCVLAATCTTLRKSIIDRGQQVGSRATIILLKGTNFDCLKMCVNLI